MALFLERNIDGTLHTINCVDGRFVFDDGLSLTIEEARQVAKSGNKEPSQERKWAFRVIDTALDI